MALTPGQVPEVATRVLAMREREQIRLKRISEYMRGKHDSVYVPHGARDEYRWLLQRSVVNFLPLIVSTISENLHVDGYLRVSGDDGTEAGALGGTAEPEDGSATSAAGLADTGNPWNIFLANRMVSRQHGVHRAVAKYGIAYNVVLPGTMQGNGDSPPVDSPVIRPVSPRRLTALYADDVDDEWPQYAVEERIMRSDKGALRVVWLYDDQYRYTLVGKVNETTLYWPGDWSGDGTNGGSDDGSSTISSGDPGWYGVPDGTPVIEEHGLSVCPVVRFLHEIDLDGEMDVSGEAEPLIPLQDQINTTTFNTLMAQQYAAFRQRWVTGMVPMDEDNRPREPFRAGVDRLFIAEDPDTKFGEFGQTDLTGFLNAREASIRHMATVAQVPPYYLMGTISNLPLALDTPVLTPLGRTIMGRLKRGDQVFAPGGSVVKVKALSPVFHDHECYRLKFDDGTEIVADAQHRWETTHFADPANPRGFRQRHLICPECGWEPGTNRAKRLGPVVDPARGVGIHRRKIHGILPDVPPAGGARETSVVTTREIAATLRTHEGRHNHYIPLAKPWDGPEQDYPIDPYVLGVWLGDGNSHRAHVFSSVPDAEQMASNLRACGETVHIQERASGCVLILTQDPARCPYGHEREASQRECRECHLIRGRRTGKRCGLPAELPARVNSSFHRRIKDLGVWKNKHIPERYFSGSFKQRLSLLQGIMDTDGTVDRRYGYVAINLHDERLVQDVHRLICSLGHKARLQDRAEYVTNMGPSSRRRIFWAALDPVFRLSRKAALQRTEFTRIGDGQRGLAGGAYGRYITACEPVDSVPVRCITVASEDHQFCVTDALIATCNSAEALAASRDSLDRKVSEIQGVLADPWKQTLRLAALAAGNKEGWTDTTSTIVWRDTSARAFAATADALGKMTQMLGIPATELWSRIPGVSAEEVARWKAVASSQGALAELNSLIESQMTKGAQTTPPDDAEPFQGPAQRRQPGV